MSSMHPTDPRHTAESTQTAAGVQRPDKHGPEMDDEQVEATGPLDDGLGNALGEELDPAHPDDGRD